MSSLPLPLLILGVLGWLGLAIRFVPRLRGPLLFLFLAFSIRYLANFFHLYTTKPVVAGQSINSFLTLGIAAIALYVCRRDLVRYRLTLPVYAFVGTLIISGVWNGEFEGLINALIRQFLFVGIILAIIAALREQGDEHSEVSKPLLAVFAIPLLYQLMSVVFRYAKAAEADGSTSYIGGYIHEGVFSTVLLAAFLVVTLSNIAWKRRTFLIIVLFTALVLANYRTSVVAAVPLALAHFALAGSGKLNLGMLAIVRGVALVTIAIVGALLFALLSERLGDIGVVLSAGSELFKPPTEFSNEERGLMSGRVMIWSDYIFTTIHSDIANVVFGFGPDAWQQSFSLYAHNVYISYIYEIGILGSVCFVLVVASFATLALKAEQSKKWILFGGHVSYVILCLGTMPTFTIEGILFYGILCGYTSHYYLVARAAATKLKRESVAITRPGRRTRAPRPVVARQFRRAGGINGQR